MRREGPASASIPTFTAPNYDSMVGKLIAWGATRDDAIARMRRALSETVISGVETTIPFHHFVLNHADFRAGKVHTGLIGELIDNRDPAEMLESLPGLACPIV